MSECECAKRLKKIEDRLTAIEAERNGRDGASTTASSTQLAGKPYGFARVAQRPVEVKA